ncbi:MAG: M28 family peptidase [Clostridium sp.]|nr:M28 family peptidase [Clostridium sp.]
MKKLKMGSFVSIIVIAIIFVLSIIIKRYSVDYKNIEDIITTLATEEYSPREILTEENDKTTKYLEDIFAELGLETVFEDSYRQKIIRGLELYNIVGKVSGENNKEAIVITAHFDAYSGSLDNSSGVAVAIEIAEKLIDDIPNKDVIFSLVNGEERDLKGSEALVPALIPMYQKIYNINIDCVGSKKAGALALKNISRVEDSSELYDSIKERFTEDKVDFEDSISSEKVKYYMKTGDGVSDYVHFEQNNLPNIHISQQGIDGLTEDMAGPESINFKNLKKLADSLSKFVVEF